MSAIGAITLQPFQHYSCFVSLGTCAKGVQLLFPSHPYPVIPYCTIFPYLAHSSDVVTYPLTQTAQHFHLPTQQLIFDKEKITIPPPQSNFLKSSSKSTALGHYHYTTAATKEFFDRRSPLFNCYDQSSLLSFPIPDQP